MATAKGTIKNNKYQTSVTNGVNSLIADEPVSDGGKEIGFSPSDLLCASLVSCTCITLRMYADRKGFPLEQVDVSVSFTRDKEANITHIERSIQLHGDLTPDQKERCLAIANSCPMHKVLSNPIIIKTTLQ